MIQTPPKPTIRRIIGDALHHGAENFTIVREPRADRPIGVMAFLQKEKYLQMDPDIMPIIRPLFFIDAPETGTWSEDTSVQEIFQELEFYLAPWVHLSDPYTGLQITAADRVWHCLALIGQRVFDPFAAVMNKYGIPTSVK